MTTFTSEIFPVQHLLVNSYHVFHTIYSFSSDNDNKMKHMSHLSSRLKTATFVHVGIRWWYVGEHSQLRMICYTVCQYLLLNITLSIAF